MISRLLCLLVFTSLFWGCDDINPPYEKKVVVDSVDTSGYQQRVLLEEFTGHTCRNCPLGHAVASQLRESYEGSVITMAVHAGAFALPEAEYPEDFRTSSGEALNNTFKVSLYPAGVVNRKPVNGQYVQSSAAWGTLVDAEVKNKAPFKLTLTPTFNAASRSLSLGVVAQTLNAYTSSKPVSIIMYIVEDSIVSPQLKGKDRIENYVHKDVLRDAPLGVFGRQFYSSNTVPANNKKDTTLTYTLPSNLPAEKCKAIVVLALPDPDYNVLQVAEVHLTK